MSRWQDYADKLADKLMDAGNLIFGALIVGQLISAREFNYWIAALEHPRLGWVLFVGLGCRGTIRSE